MPFDDFNRLRQAYFDGQTFTAIVHKAGTSNAAGAFYSLWGFTGQPTQGLYTAGASLTSVQCDEGSPVGALEHGSDVPEPTITKHLTRIAASALTNSSQAPYYLILYDRLLFYAGIDATSTASQALTNSVGLPRYTDGNGVMAWLEVTTNFGAGTGVLTFGDDGYTNSDGTGGRQHGITVNTLASALVNRLPHSGGITNQNNFSPFLPLQGGDHGVRSVQSIRFTSAHAAGVCALVLGRPLAVISVPQFKLNCEKDMILNNASLPRIYNGACLSFLFWSPAAIGSSVVQGLELDFTWGP